MAAVTLQIGLPNPSAADLQIEIIASLLSGRLAHEKVGPAVQNAAQSQVVVTAEDNVFGVPAGPPAPRDGAPPAEQIPDTAGFIVSFRVDSDVISLDGGREGGALLADAEVGEDGKLHVTVRKSTSSCSEVLSRRSHGGGGGVSSLTPPPSNLTNTEIHSLQSSRNPTPRGSSFNNANFYSVVNGRILAGLSPRTSNFGNLGLDEESGGSAAVPWLPRVNTPPPAYPAPPGPGMIHLPCIDSLLLSHGSCLLCRRDF